MAWLRSDILQFCRDNYGEDGSARAQRNFDRAMNDANKALHAAGNWDFDRAKARVVFEAQVNTGTVSVNVDGTTVTGVGTAFAAGDVGKYVRFAGEDFQYLVTAYTSPTSIEIEAYRGDANLSGSEYMLTRDRVALPSDFRTLFVPQADEPAWELEPVHLDDLWIALKQVREISVPRVCSVEYFTSKSDGTGKSAYLWIYPSASQKYAVDVPYFAFPKEIVNLTDGISAPSDAEAAHREFLRAYLHEQAGETQKYLAQLGVARKRALEDLAAYQSKGTMGQRQMWNIYQDDAWYTGRRRRIWPAAGEPVHV